MRSKYEQYLMVLNTMGSSTVDLSKLLEILINLSYADIERDFKTLDITIESKIVKVDEAKWKIRRHIDSLKQNYTIPIKYEDNLEIVSHFKNISKSSIINACIRDSAFKYTTTYPEDILLSLALLKENKVAFKHQIKNVNTVIHKLNDRGLIIDEVGLGKTVTALLWLYEHIIRANREITALILVPSNLKKQWCDAFSEFFGEKISLNQKSASNYKNSDILLLSIDQAKLGDVAKILMQREWDCLVLDESHEIKNTGRIRFKFVYSLNAAYKLFLSATPVHNSAYDLYAQTLPLLPGLLGNKKQFSNNNLVEDKYIRNPSGLKKDLEVLLLRNRRIDIPFNFTKRNYITKTIDNWTEHEYELYNDLLKLLIGVFKKQLPKAVMLKGQVGERTIADFVLKSMLLLCEMASHPDTALDTINNTLKPTISEYAKATFDNTYLDRLNVFIDRYIACHHNLAKVNCLIDILKNVFSKSSRRVIIYLNYIKTSEAIKKTIKDEFKNDIDIYTYIGMLPSKTKISTINAFINSNKAILISTDAGGQGLNLNAADVIINYDYPWNPMKVEQRIGRIDRLSTKYKNIYIYNLITKGTIEQYIYQTLIEKISIVEDTIGDIMSPIEIEKEWERKFMVSLGHIVLSSEDSSDLKRKFEKLDKESLSNASTQYSTLILERYKHGLD